MNRKKAFSFICKKLLNIKRVPKGWRHQREHGYEWNLIADNASLRSTLQEAFKDYFEFMKAHNIIHLLRIRLDEQYFVQNYSTSIF